MPHTRKFHTGSTTQTQLSKHDGKVSVTINRSAVTLPTKGGFYVNSNNPHGDCKKTRCKMRERERERERERDKRT